MARHKTTGASSGVDEEARRHPARTGPVAPGVAEVDLFSSGLFRPVPESPHSQRQQYHRRGNREQEDEVDSTTAVATVSMDFPWLLTGCMGKHSRPPRAVSTEKTSAAATVSKEGP